MTTNIIDRAQTLAVDGINATRVRTPESRPVNQYDKCREFELIFSIPGAEQRDDQSDRYDANGKTVYNAIRVTIEHNGHRKVYRAVAKACFIHKFGTTEVFGFGASAAPENQLTPNVAAGRYSRKGLDALATQVFDDLTANGFPREDAALADLWDTIVESHGVARPALIPAGA